MDSKYSRRKFIKHNTLTGFGAVMSMGLVPSPFTLATPSPSTVNSLHIRPRYHRWHVDPGVEWLEKNTTYATLDWSIPLANTALVLVDVWQRHYLKDTEERGEKIIQEKLLPLISTCRGSGMRIIHPPSPSVAQTHVQWVKLVSEEEMKSKRDDWPPREFQNLSGPYRTYGKLIEPREKERQELPELTFHPDVRPLSGEPVVATGEDLHRYCKKEGILFLLYAGFNTNACILSRDYGTIQMSNRGYQVVLVRDCTTGMESAETHATLGQTLNAVLLLEMFGQYSVLSDEIIQGFSPKQHTG